MRQGTRQTTRTKKAYANLYDDPRSLFGDGPDNPGVDTILFPNGEKELWLKDSRGHGVRIIASAGPHGMGIRISAMGGTRPITNRAGERSIDTREVELTVYNDTPHARAFSRWYDHTETADDIALLGPGYQRHTVVR